MNVNMKCGILLAAFGSTNSQGESTLKNFDASVRARFPDIPVRWAFTSLLLRERLAAARVKKDSVAKALQKMCFEKYTHVVVQPLQTIPGSEYEAVLFDVQSVMAQYASVKIRVGAPLLARAIDVELCARAVVRHVPCERCAHEAVVFMGHGALHPAVACYTDLARAVYELDAHVHVGTMNGAATLDHILPKLAALPKSSKVWLMPLLSIVGQHALKDMAGKEPDSWLSRIEKAGYPCTAVLHGLVEYTSFADIWLSHLQETMEALLHDS